ncbi:hypothetical protein ZOD2009_12887 [Haladaptatus paucihalophilus DX253]|uniref:Uncharacterized protein n=1 Tax=Haladaptatus paucihalophilus DX253 TaxID=797209 RepID=E7QUU2_HALPU|nr:hypothetical protein ZOD2009_12887 [Haladaptatus paucihalophilus DX253]
MALDDDFVILDDERYFTRDGAELAVAAGTENSFEGVHIDDVVEGL